MYDWAMACWESIEERAYAKYLEKNAENWFILPF
jgi:hypothetical protein